MTDEECEPVTFVEISESVISKAMKKVFLYRSSYNGWINAFNNV